MNKGENSMSCKKFPIGMIKHPDSESPDIIEFKSSELYTVDTVQAHVYDNNGKGMIRKPAIENRSNGTFERKGFYLSNYFDWHIIRDDKNCLVLIPTKKYYE
jgi:hypothetical protein